MSAAKLRIVVVEDQGVIALLLTELLEQLGHDIVAVAATEAAAVEAAKLLAPELMIVDEGLGEGCGTAAMEIILQKSYVPHVFVSGDPSALLAKRLDAVVLDKPFSETELVNAIERAVRLGMSCKALSGEAP